ncbi:MAG TPA: lysylphosphatidylglycerol synthase domain-containing protein [Candidatus Saccharimonadales bacterium]|nr:lysylphosphatidylglycerol synthase domain-containing protein [Candidatus Saccharimonadales bacterium]
MQRRLKAVLAPLIVLATIGAFAYYIHAHPQTVQSLEHIGFGTLAALLGLYLLFFAALAAMTRASLLLYRKSISLQENLLFNAYSSLVNFFGPGQSGPVFRGAYLKKRHRLSVRHYMFATLLYYAFFAVISAMLVCIGTRPWWQTLFLMLVAAALSIAVVLWYAKRARVGKGTDIDWPSVGWIFAATVAQLSLQAIIFGIELHSVGAHASAGQVMAYTGVANFALFVSLTPGAIGIRESFLLLSERLHHISHQSVIAASVLDRGVYLLLLGVLAVFAIALHAKRQLIGSSVDHT